MELIGHAREDGTERVGFVQLEVAAARLRRELAQSRIWLVHRPASEAIAGWSAAGHADRVEQVFLDLGSPDDFGERRRPAAVGRPELARILAVGQDEDDASSLEM